MAREPGAHTAPGRNREQVIAELREGAAGQVRAMVTGEDWAEWLRVAARFPGWSFTNILLIAAQRPDATLLSGYQEWQDRGRQVRKREPSIQLIAEPGPGSAEGAHSQVASRATRDPGERGGGAPRLVYMWDISQTSGPPTTDPTPPLAARGAAPPGLWDVLTWLARREGFAVKRAAFDVGDSETRWSAHRICVRPGLDPPAAVRALLHELGHVLAHANLAYLLGMSTAGCRGIQKIEADSIACIVATRLGMDTSIYTWPYMASWAGSDPRARPEETIRAVGERITQAAEVVTAHLDVALFGLPDEHTPDGRPQVLELVSGARERTSATVDVKTKPAPARRPATDSAPPVAVLSRMLLDAERFYRAHLSDSWVPGYMASRGLGPATMEQWRAGYAPAGWTTLTSHLRSLGYGDAAIETAGLARRSSRGTLIDHFRDRVMLAVRDERGTVAGFIGRARPDAGPDVPKYLNSPETPVYRKGDLLFGLHEARDQLAGGAMPVIVEGPFDAMAVSAAGAGRYEGLAPCGTALTVRQVRALALLAGLDRTGLLVALDGDRAGHDGIVKAYEILLAHTGKLSAAILPTGRDPADILQVGGPTALCDALRRTEPLAQVVIDAHLDRWDRRLDHAEGQLAAMRSAASLVARSLRAETGDLIQQVNTRQHPSAQDDELGHVVSPELPMIAQLLPTGAISQIVRIAERTRSDYSEVTAEVVRAITSNPASREQRQPSMAQRVPAARGQGGQVRRSE